MTAICSISDCGKEVIARKLCRRHYKRWQKHGDPAVVLPTYTGTGRDRDRKRMRDVWKSMIGRQPLPAESAEVSKMSSYHQITIVGYCGHDPDTRTTPSGVSVTNVSVATSENWKDKAGEKQERTTWFRVAFFDRLSEVAAQYLRKGSLVLVTGTVSTNPYINREGQAAASLEVRGRELKMLGSARGEQDPAHSGGAGPAAARAAARGQSAPQQRSFEEPKPAHEEEFDDDIPF